MQILGLIVNFLIFSLIHSFTASLTFKDFAKKIMGDSYRYYRFIYVFISVVSWILLMHIFAPEINGTLYAVHGLPYYLLRLVQISGLFLVANSLNTFNVWDFLGIKSLMAAEPTDRQNESLYTKGLYSFTRHPIYLFSLLAIWTNPIMTYYWLWLCILITAYCYFGSIFEERKLVLQYGQQYVEYQKRVPRIIPLSIIVKG